MPSRRAPAPPVDQLALFASPAQDALAREHRECAPIAARVSPRMHFGTSSWAFPGWTGLVYPRRASESELARDGLRDYARHPLLRTVGIDRGYYAPIPPRDLERYAEQLPAGFRCCTKASELVTAPVHLGHGRGERGTANPDFLSPSYFMDTMGGPFLEYFGAHTGPFVFEFPPVPAEHRLDPADFAERLERFLTALPPEIPCAVELRDRALLTPAYRAVLARRKAAHVYNYWSRMPLPGAQIAQVPVDTAGFVVVRLLMRPGSTYEARKQAFAPFDRIVDEDPAMRADVVRIALEALKRDLATFVLVNNKAEGSAPRTIRALAERLAAE